MSYFDHIHCNKVAGFSGKSKRYRDMSDEANEWIETAAYYIWLEEGCPEGRDKEHWNSALQMFLSRLDH